MRARLFVCALLVAFASLPSTASATVEDKTWGAVKGLYRETAIDSLAQKGSEGLPPAPGKKGGQEDTISAIGDATGIKWPFGWWESPNAWKGLEGDRSGGDWITACGRWIFSHSQADYYSRDLSRWDGSSPGKPIYAGRSGYVLRSGPDGGYGNSVVIWVPGENIQIRYAHMATTAVNYCGWVYQGQYIGTVGNTPGGFRAHLHLTVYKNVPVVSGWPQFVGNLCRGITYACAVYFYS